MKRDSVLFIISLIISIALMTLVEYHNYAFALKKNGSTPVAAKKEENRVLRQKEEILKELINRGVVSNKVGMYWHRVTGNER